MALIEATRLFTIIIILLCYVDNAYAGDENNENVKYDIEAMRK